MEIRGRWKGQKNGRVVNCYINVEQLPTDAKLAGILAVGGPIMYKVKDGSNVTHDFLMDTVVPSIKQFFELHEGEESNKIADVLAPALLWVCMTPGLEHMVSDEVLTRVRDGYAAIRGQHPVDYNPVEKVPLSIYRIENQVHIEPMVALNPDGEDDNGTAAEPDRNQDNQRRRRQYGTALLPGHLQHANREEIAALTLTVHRMDRRMRQNFQQMQVSPLFFLCVIMFVLVVTANEDVCCFRQVCLPFVLTVLPSLVSLIGT